MCEDRWQQTSQAHASVPVLAQFLFQDARVIYQGEGASRRRGRLPLRRTLTVSSQRRGHVYGLRDYLTARTPFVGW